MREIQYLMTFEGRIAQRSEANLRISVETQASLPASLDENLKQGTMQASLKAVIESDAFGHFFERGEIIFGKGTLFYTSETEGFIGEAPDPSVQYGYAVRRVSGGSGFFEGATGYIVSTFTVNDQGLISDRQSAVIFIS